MPQRYEAACALLPRRLREAALAVPEKEKVEELRLRQGGRLTLTLPEGEVPVPGTRVTGEDLEAVLDIATGSSRYTASQSLRQGYLTAEGGFRIGVCGTAVLEGGEVALYRDLSSLNIRIPREQIGLADRVLPGLLAERRLESTLVISPPGGGKTTLLRDLVRQLSDRFGQRVGVVDSRGELASCVDGQPQLAVGRRTDVISLIPKAAGMELLLRTMNPQWIAVDEITAPADVETMAGASYCGVSLLATAHAYGLEDLQRRPLYRQLMELGIFTRLVVLDRNKHLRMERTA